MSDVLDVFITTAFAYFATPAGATVAVTVGLAGLVAGVIQLSWILSDDHRSRRFASVIRAMRRGR